MQLRQLHLKRSQLAYFIFAIWDNGTDQISLFLPLHYGSLRTLVQDQQHQVQRPLFPVHHQVVYFSHYQVLLVVDSISVLIFFPLFSICSILHFVNIHLNEERYPRLKACTISLIWSFFVLWKLMSTWQYTATFLALTMVYGINNYQFLLLGSHRRWTDFS